MDWHTVASASAPTWRALAFRQTSMDKIGLISGWYFAVKHLFQSPHLRGRYASSYYILWAEVLDADAFKAFSRNR